MRTMLVGYARVSTADQSLDPQTDALTAAGCEKLFTDVASGARTERPGVGAGVSVLPDGRYAGGLEARSDGPLDVSSD